MRPSRRRPAARRRRTPRPRSGARRRSARAACRPASPRPRRRPSKAACDRADGQREVGVVGARAPGCARAPATSASVRAAPAAGSARPRGPPRPRTAGSSDGVTSSTHSIARGTPSSTCRASTRRTSSAVNVVVAAEPRPGVELPAGALVGEEERERPDLLGRRRRPRHGVVVGLDARRRSHRPSVPRPAAAERLDFWRMLVSERIGQFFVDSGSGRDRLEYTEYGAGDAWVVLLHGQLMPRRMHQPLARALAGRGAARGHPRPARPRPLRPAGRPAASTR